MKIAKLVRVGWRERGGERKRKTVTVCERDREDAEGEIRV